MKQLLIFSGLAYLISWTIWLPLYGHVFGLTNLQAIPFNHAIGGFGPLIASFLTTWIFLKADGVNKLLVKCVQIKPLTYLAIALFSPFILALLALVASHFIHGTSINISGLLTTKEFPQWNWLTFFLYNLIFFGFGEEVGWPPVSARLQRVLTRCLKEGLTGLTIVNLPFQSCPFCSILV